LARSASIARAKAPTMWMQAISPLKVDSKLFRAGHSYLRRAYLPLQPRIYPTPGKALHKNLSAFNLSLTSLTSTVVALKVESHGRRDIETAVV
jgi:hypothetical protein